MISKAGVCGTIVFRSSNYIFFYFQVESLESKGEVCCMTLDEMSIKQCIKYDSASGTIYGNVTLPEYSKYSTECCSNQDTFTMVAANYIRLRVHVYCQQRTIALTKRSHPPEMGSKSMFMTDMVKRV